MEFVVGMLANCCHEGDVGQFEDTNGTKYEYWCYMNGYYKEVVTEKWENIYGALMEQ